MRLPNFTKAVHHAGPLLEAALKGLVPVRTGTLRNSIVIKAYHRGNDLRITLTLADYYRFIRQKRNGRVIHNPVQVEPIETLEPTADGDYRPLNLTIEQIISNLSDALAKDLEEYVNSISF